MALVNLVSPEDYEHEVLRLRQNDADGLAPGFRTRSDDAIAECNQKGFDVASFECCRSDTLARLYFAHGASMAPDARYTWHFYGLARDVISKARGWDVYPDAKTGKGGDPDWYRPVWEIARAHKLDLGADWVHFKDYPHWQFGGIRPTPLVAVTLYRDKGLNAVWDAVGALAA